MLVLFDEGHDRVGVDRGGLERAELRQGGRKHAEPNGGENEAGAGRPNQAGTTGSLKPGCNRAVLQALDEQSGQGQHLDGGPEREAVECQHIKRAAEQQLGNRGRTSSPKYEEEQDRCCERPHSIENRPSQRVWQ